MSKEPLAPAVADGDPQWHDAVTWIVFALLEAEELGITSQNLDSFTKSTDPVIQRFLGQASSAETEQTDALGVGLGLTNDFTTRIVKHVGNYGEIYNRHLGPTTQLNLPRGLNRPWNQGGLLYSPPFR
jgi:general L-amino acid transport system substrate-binding protein